MEERSLIPLNEGETEKVNKSTNVSLEGCRARRGGEGQGNGGRDARPPRPLIPESERRRLRVPRPGELAGVAGAQR